jgi:hypothetical protein
MRSAAAEQGAGVEVGGFVVIPAAVPSLGPRQQNTVCGPVIVMSVPTAYRCGDDLLILSVVGMIFGKDRDQFLCGGYSTHTQARIAAHWSAAEAAVARHLLRDRCHRQEGYVSASSASTPAVAIRGSGSRQLFASFVDGHQPGRNFPGRLLRGPG